MRHGFVHERALITTTLIYSGQWENAFLSLIVNYCKILQKNKLCPPKQQ